MKIKYYTPRWGVSSYRKGELLKFRRNVYKIIGKTNKSLKLQYIRKRKVGVD